MPGTAWLQGLRIVSGVHARTRLIESLAEKFVRLSGRTVKCTLWLS